VRIPVWFALTAAVGVMLFGAYRIRLGLTWTAEQEEAAKRRGGLYAMGKRFHIFVGSIYIVMGTALLAMGFGWQPFGSSIGPGTATPATDKAPAKGNTIPLEQLPAKK
jgi:hypothetical protein